MKGTGIDRELYVAICKDDDRIYTERVRYDKEAAEALVARGHRITLSERLLEPLSADPNLGIKCKFCAAHDFLPRVSHLHPVRSTAGRAPILQPL